MTDFYTMDDQGQVAVLKQFSETALRHWNLEGSQLSLIKYRENAVFEVLTSEQKRYALPNSRIMIHQPSGGAQGQATDIEIQAKEILALRNRLNNMYVEHTGQELETIENALERDRYMTPEEAADFGLIDEVVLKRPEEEDGDTDFSDDEGEDQGKE